MELTQSIDVYRCPDPYIRVVECLKSHFKTTKLKAVTDTLSLFAPDSILHFAILHLSHRSALWRRKTTRHEMAVVRKASLTFRNLASYI